jgi:hypothetical protein
MRDYFGHLFSQGVKGVKGVTHPCKPCSAYTERLPPENKTPLSVGVRGQPDLKNHRLGYPHKPLNENLSIPSQPNQALGVTPITPGYPLKNSRFNLEQTEMLMYEFEERAAILEYEGGLSQEEAELRAGKEILWAYIQDHEPQIWAKITHIIANEREGI